jgi:cholesterol transport system auxiliary component
MIMRPSLVFAASAAFLLAACVGNVRQHEIASYDFGAVAIAWQTPGIPVTAIDVAAPSWLAGSGMHYRLLYADGQRRMTYTESRWAAAPAELLAQALRRQPASGESGCRLKLDIDEFAQIFETPQSSRLQLDVRASLLPARGNGVLAHKAFAVSAAAGADARQGAAAAATAAKSLGAELNAWLRQAAIPADRCRAG